MVIGFESSSKDKTKVVNRYVCSTCHGTGLVACSKCGGKGERKCPHCDGTGHACPVCSRGYVKKERWINCGYCHGKGYTTYERLNGEIGKKDCYHCSGRGQVKETYKELCPNCHGDYKATDHVCDKCGGKKKISCAKHEGCPSCGGRGKWSEVHDKASKCNLGLFRAFSMAFGFTGLQYLYIGRWLLFVLQFSTFAALGVMVIFFEPVLSFVSRFGIDRECLTMIKNLIGVCVLLNLVLGMVIIKCDAQGGTLNHEYKRGWYWLFFLLFGWTGAHLAYVSRRVRDLYWCFAYGLVMTPIFVNVIVSEIKGCANKDFDMGDVLVRLIVYGAIFVIFMGGGTKFVRKMIESRSC